MFILNLRGGGTGYCDLFYENNPDSDVGYEEKYGKLCAIETMFGCLLAHASYTEFERGVQG